ncbi:MAG: alpha/beta hydrolase [Gemmata sp.]
MRRFAPLAVVLLSAGAGAADDLTVLKSGKDDPPPRKMLHAALLAECDEHFATRREEIAKLKTPADVARRQAALREKFVEALGGFPEKAPLNARTVGTLKREGYAVEKVIFESRPDHHVTANFYLPDGPGPFPAVLMPLGHSANGKAADYMQRAAILLAKNGIAALVYDPIGQGERSQLLDKLGNPAIKGSTSEHTAVGVGAILVGRSTASYRVWDGIRSIDYLTSRKEIDPKKIGCTGSSGGGTMTSYLMALDDRIVAAAPSCYITSLERLFATIGPQDAEQNVTGQVALGLDHADYIFLHAPKPTLVLSATRDFFDIKGTKATVAEAKGVYKLLGADEKFGFVEVDSTHGYPRAHREAMARFMSRWLKGEDRAVEEVNITIEKDADLRCTRTGQVLDDLRGKSVFDLNAALATDLAKARAKEWKAADLRAAVARATGAVDVKQAASTSSGLRDVPQGDYTLRPLLFAPEGSKVPVPAVLFIRDPSDARPVAFHVSDRGKKTAVGSAEEALFKTGKRVLALDLCGWGETGAAVPPNGARPMFGDFKESFLGLHLNRPLLGRRTADLVAVAQNVKTSVRTQSAELFAVGSGGPVALHAAVLSDYFSAVTLDGALVSWDSVARTPLAHDQLASVVPGALKVYDLPDLAAAIAPRPLTVRNPVDATGKPLSKDAAEQAYKPVRDAYQKAGAADKFKLVVDTR